MSECSTAYSEYSAEGTTFGYITYGSGSDTNPYRCTLVSVTSSSDTVFIPATLEGYNVTEIADGAMFQISGTSRIVIPSTVTAVGDSALPTGGAEIYFMGDRPSGNLPSADTISRPADASGWTAEKTFTTVSTTSEDGSSVICAVIGDEAMVIDGTPSSNGSLTIPAKAGGFPVKSIGPYAFGADDKGDNNKTHRTDVTSVTVEYGVEIVRERAFFYQSALEKVILPDSVTDIMDEVFRSDTALVECEIPGSVTRIGFETFRECSSLKEITIPDSVTELCEGSFRLCRSATDLTVGAGITRIPIHCFEYGDSLTSVTFRGTITDIEGCAFYMCKGLEEFTIPDSVRTVGDAAFAECTSLSLIDLGDGLETIGKKAFYDCGNLKEVTFPESLRSIGDDAFWGCRSLEKAIFEGDMPEIGTKTFPSQTAIVLKNGGKDSLPIGPIAIIAAMALLAAFTIWHMRRKSHR